MNKTQHKGLGMQASTLSPLDLGSRNPKQLIPLLKKGLSTDLFSKVATSLNISERQLAKTVHRYYWDNDFNCATTTLLILSEYFEIPIEPQVLDAAIGMHGAGGYQAQCGLVEGALMFIGILGRARRIEDEQSVSFCKSLARKFEQEFKSLECRILRPEGFHPDNPPHLCEELTCKAIAHNIGMISSWLDRQNEATQ